MTTQAKTKLLPFFKTCVDWPIDKLSVLDYILDNAKSVTRRAFLARVNHEDLKQREIDLGCNPNMHAEYYMCWGPGHAISTAMTKPIYYFNYSAINNVFATEEQVHDFWWAIREVKYDSRVVTRSPDPWRDGEKDSDDDFFDPW